MTTHNIRGVEVTVTDTNGESVATDVIILIRSMGSDQDGAPLDDHIQVYSNDVPGIVQTGMLQAAAALDTAAWHWAQNKRHLEGR